MWREKVYKDILKTKHLMSFPIFISGCAILLDREVLIEEEEKVDLLKIWNYQSHMEK